MQVSFDSSLKQVMLFREKVKQDIEVKEMEIDRMLMLLWTKLWVDWEDFYLWNKFLWNSFKMYSSDYWDYFLFLEGISSGDKVLVPKVENDYWRWDINTYIQSKYDAINFYWLQPMVYWQPDQIDYTSESYTIWFFKTVNVDLWIENINMRLEDDITFRVNKLKSELTFLRESIKT